MKFSHFCQNEQVKERTWRNPVDKEASGMFSSNQGRCELEFHFYDDFGVKASRQV